MPASVENARSLKKWSIWNLLPVVINKKYFSWGLTGVDLTTASSTHACTQRAFSMLIQYQFCLLSLLSGRKDKMIVSCSLFISASLFLQNYAGASSRLVPRERGDFLHSSPVSSHRRLWDLTAGIQQWQSLFKPCHFCRDTHKTFSECSLKRFQNGVSKKKEEKEQLVSAVNKRVKRAKTNERAWDRKVRTFSVHAISQSTRSDHTCTLVVFPFFWHLLLSCRPFAECLLQVATDSRHSSVQQLQVQWILSHLYIISLSPCAYTSMFLPLAIFCWPCIHHCAVAPLWTVFPWTRGTLPHLLLIPFDFNF